MSIKLTGATSGSIELDVPAAVSGGDISLTLPNGVGSAGQYLRNSSTAGTLEFGSLNSGKILVVQSTKTDINSITGGTYQDLGLSVSLILFSYKQGFSLVVCKSTPIVPMT